MGQATIPEAEGEAQAIQLVNEAAEKYFIGNAQLLQARDGREGVVAERQDRDPGDSDLVNMIGDMAGVAPLPIKPAQPNPTPGQPPSETVTRAHPERAGQTREPPGPPFLRTCPLGLQLLRRPRILATSRRSTCGGPVVLAQAHDPSLSCSPRSLLVGLTALSVFMQCPAAPPVPPPPSQSPAVRLSPPPSRDSVASRDSRAPRRRRPLYARPGLVSREPAGPSRRRHLRPAA